jgi:hypothetical protein
LQCGKRAVRSIKEGSVARIFFSDRTNSWLRRPNGGAPPQQRATGVSGSLAMPGNDATVARTKIAGRAQLSFRERRCNSLE